MADRPLFYYITDRTQFGVDDKDRRRRLLDKIREAAACGVDYIQLREKDLPARDLEELARQAVAAIREASQNAPAPVCRLLINSRADIALAVGADGIHLRSDDVSIADQKALRDRSPLQQRATWHISVSCHSEQEVKRAATHRANFVVFGPVFQKGNATGSGLEALRRVSRHAIPVLALGGVTVENAPACMAAGASGIAGIRLFQQNNIADVVRQIKERVASE